MVVVHPHRHPDGRDRVVARCQGHVHPDDTPPPALRDPLERGGGGARLVLLGVRVDRVDRQVGPEEGQARAPREVDGVEEAGGGTPQVCAQQALGRVRRPGGVPEDEVLLRRRRFQAGDAELFTRVKNTYVSGLCAQVITRELASLLH